MIEPELKYCPQCDDEYMPEIEKCHGCGVVLITGRQKMEVVEARRLRLEGRRGELSPDDDLVNLRRGPLAEMKQLEKVLGREVIPCLVAADDASCSGRCCPTNFFLQVRRDDIPDAVAALEQEFRRTTSLDEHDTTHAEMVFDPSAQAAVCPACGHSFAPTSASCPDCGLQLA